VLHSALSFVQTHLPFFEFADRSSERDSKPTLEGASDKSTSFALTEHHHAVTLRASACTPTRP